MSGIGHVGVGSMLPTRKPRQNRLKAKPFRTLATALAMTPPGETFYVQQLSGKGVYEYVRTETSYTFVGMQIDASRLKQQAAPAVAASNLPALPAAVTNFWNTTTALLWDGRAIVNSVATTAPTLNLVPDPFVMLDEQGDTTPTRTVFDVTVTDPLGTHYATTGGWTAQSQPLEWYVRANTPGLPQTDYTSVLKVIQADATTGTIQVGAASNVAGQFAGVAVSGSWQTLTKKNTAYSPSSTFEMGVTQATGGGTLNVGMFNLQWYDLYGAGSIPGDQAEFSASQAGHIKPPAAYPGAITTDPFGWVKAAGNFDNLIACFQQLNVTEMTFGGVVDVQTQPASTYANLIAVATHSATGVNAANKGQLGVNQADYRVYCNPSLGTLVARSTDVLLNQGPVSLILSAKPNQITVYINAVPVFSDTTSSGATGWTSFLLERLFMMAYDGLKKRHQASNKLADPAGFFFFAPQCLSQSDVTAVDKRMCAEAKLSGKPMGVRKACVVGCGDSLTAFSPSPFWHMNESASLKPGLHTVMDAAGGSFYNPSGPVGGTNTYNEPTRQAFRRTMISAALAAGYERVYVQWKYGHNDIVTGVMTTLGTWQAGRDTIDAMIFADKAACDDGSGRLKTVLVTIPPYAGFTTTQQQVCDAYNAASLTDYASRGYDFLIPIHQWVPPGWASFFAASLDAFTKSADNDVFLSPGLHYCDNGGINAANANYVPFYAAQLATLNGNV